MQRCVVFVIGGALAVMSLIASAAVPGIKTGAFRLLSRDQSGWTFAVQAVPRPLSHVVIGGNSYTVFSGEPQERNALPGSPYLPAEPLSIGVPFDAVITADLVDPVYEDTKGMLVAPVPSYRLTKEHEAVAEYALDNRAYSRDAYLPSTTLVVDPPFVLRQQRICTIHLAPYQYNAARKSLRRLVSGTLRVRYTGGTAKAAAQRTSKNENDPGFEDVYRSLVANYAEARGWRAPARNVAGAPIDSTGSWFETGRRYLRIPVARDGWYVISQQLMQNAGLNMSLYGEADVRLFAGGQSVPFFFRPDTSIEFYGVQRRGDTTAYDFYSDTSMYWLTFQGRGTPLPMRTGTAPAGSPTSAVSFVHTVRHFEQNTDYYEGTGDAEITQNGPVDGEGWVWSYFYPNTTTSFPFTLDHLVIVPGDSAYLTIKLFSTTLHYNTPDHIARFWVNDSLAGEVQFIGRTRGFVRVAIPPGWLKEGSNSLKITSVATPSVPNQFYLDWFEVEYTRALTALGGGLAFTGVPGSGVTTYTVNGLPDSLVDAVDLASARRIPGLAVSGSVATGYSAVFTDSLGSGHHYVVVSQGGRTPVAGIRAKEFADIRNRPGGADYIIVTHRVFLTAANLLASHRAAHNGVRSYVADVDALYDEFGFGLKSSEAIKAFLAYAYAHWPGPAPSSVLFFGDASWDPHFFMSTSVKTDYVPAYGVPAGDNWYGCFDPAYPFLSSLLIGRLTVQDTVQARRTVDKVIGFDTPTLADWNKNFMFITGGIGASEQASFDALIEPLVASNVLAPPIGGTPFRVYKNSDDVINGDKKAEMQALFKNGLVFTNFLGHAAGRIWNVDIGDPNDLENTTGMLPFVASTSCNVSAFAEPSSNVLSEDFVLADNRAAIAMWGASSLGYANSGTRLVNFMLTAVAQDSVRGFGTATSIARYKLWQESGSGYITLGMVNLNPLLGDPLSELPIPREPDIAVNADDFILNTSSPSPVDSVLAFRTVVHEFGLLPRDSISVSLADTYNGTTQFLVSGMRFHATGHRDTLSLPWPAAHKPGQHRLTLTMDPAAAIPEVTKDNNTVIRDQYVYADIIVPVRPMESMVVPVGQQHLRVTSPIGGDRGNYTYTFELDTLPDFSSPFKIAADNVTPGPVLGEWVTPSLAAGPGYYWRARTVASGLFGNWVTGSFRAAAGARDTGVVRLSVSSAGQFGRGSLDQLSAADSGISIVRNAPVHLYARSVGPRTDWLVDLYSIFRINEQTVRGYWWVIGSSFLLLRVNDFTGEIAVRGFDVSAQAAQADSMRQYIQSIPAGNYVGIIVIFDGKTNVTDSLYAAIESLGSTKIRSVLSGQSWAFLGRKGHPGTALEQLTNDSAVVSLDVDNVYGVGRGTYRSPVMPLPARWDSLQWHRNVIAGKTAAILQLLGKTSAGVFDTVRTIPVDSTAVSLAGVEAILADPKYTGFSLAGALSTTDPVYSPLLRDIGVTLVPGADLAISPQTIGPPVGAPPGTGDMGMPVTVYNIGYRKADSARVTISVPGPAGRTILASAEIGGIPADSSRSTILGFSTQGLSGPTTLEVQVAPPSGSHDMIAENNSAFFTVNFTSVAEPLQATMQVYADGIQLMDGDYVSSRPNVTVRLVDVSGVGAGGERVAFFVDRNPVQSSLASLTGGTNGAVQNADERAQYAPVLTDGVHDLAVRLYRWNGKAGTDSIERRVTVNVQSEVRVLRVFNYPNPFRTETEFTFVLTGSRAPDEVSIRIFTIAGRRLREIRVTQPMLQVGFNRVYWDGRDAEGDEIANGYYLYQVQVRTGDAVQTAIEKLVKMR